MVSILVSRPECQSTSNAPVIPSAKGMTVSTTCHFVWDQSLDQKQIFLYSSIPVEHFQTLITHSGIYKYMWNVEINNSMQSYYVYVVEKNLKKILKHYKISASGFNIVLKSESFADPDNWNECTNQCYMLYIWYVDHRIFIKTNFANSKNLSQKKCRLFLVKSYIYSVLHEASSYSGIIGVKVSRIIYSHKFFLQNCVTVRFFYIHIIFRWP